jgi:hypothetical protein
MAIIKKEFYIVNRDIIVSKEYDIRPYLSYKRDNVFVYDVNNNIKKNLLNNLKKNYKIKSYL